MRLQPGEKGAEVKILEISNAPVGGQNPYTGALHVKKSDHSLVKTLLSCCFPALFLTFLKVELSAPEAMMTIGNVKGKTV